MNKTNTINSILEITKFHENQMKMLQDLVDGKKSEKPISITKIDCEFGKWLYSNENHLQSILGLQFYEKLDILHTQWHEVYHKIYLVFFNEKQKSFFSKIFKDEEKDAMQLDKAKLYYSELKQTSNELLKILKSSQRRLKAMNESKFY